VREGKLLFLGWWWGGVRIEAGAGLKQEVDRNKKQRKALKDTLSLSTRIHQQLEKQKASAKMKERKTWALLSLLFLSLFLPSLLSLHVKTKLSFIPILVWGKN
jgi:hypothetical protein